VTTSQLPQQQAQAAGLVYSDSNSPGYTRKGCGKGFKYLDENGQLIQGALRKRLAALVVPPAWKDVWLNPDPNGHLLATGYDSKGRKQYLYHPVWLEQSRRNNFDKLASFADALPLIRKTARDDMESRDGGFRSLLGLAVLLLDQGLIRIGNTSYQQENGTVGLTTLRHEHVTFCDGAMELSFIGKSGVERYIRIDDADLAHYVRECHELDGQTLLQYEDDSGSCCELSSSDINAYLREISGSDITAKDFRTWGGTVAALECYLNGETDSVQMVKYASGILGNTEAVAREHYIHPAVLALCDGTRPLADAEADEWLSASERMAVSLISDY